MYQAKLNKLKMSPIVFLSNEIFKLEVNYTLQTKLPAFPKELQENTSMIRKGLEKGSAFAVSKYLMEDLINMKPLTILKNVASAPLKVTSQIIQAKSQYIKKNWLERKIFAKYPTNGIVVKINSRKLQLLREKSLSQNNEWQYAIEK